MDILFVAIPRGNEPVAYAPNLVESPSLHDYDAVVVDMDWVWPQDLRQDIQPEPGQNYVTWANRSEYERFNYPIQVKREEAIFLLKKGGIIICLMQPPMGVRFGDFSSTVQVFSYDWIPVKGLSELVRPANGTRVKKVRRTAFDDYLDLDGVFWNADLRETSQVDYNTVAANDAGLAIAAEIRAEGSSVFLLPFSNHEEGFRVLRDCVKKAWNKYVERTPPDWIAGWVVPGEQEIVGKLRNVQKKINSLRNEEQTLSQEVRNKMTVKTLLYEQGPPLERAVRAALEELGYRLEKEGDMDLVAAEIGERAIFEVTGSEGAIDVNKLRQLRDYVETEEQRTNQVPRSILVGNHEINKPPEKRGQPFTDRCVRQSKVHGTCLLPTTELFQAVILSRQAKLDSKDFWASLMKTTGIFKL